MGGVSNVAMTVPVALIDEAFLPSLSTFATPPYCLSASPVLTGRVTPWPKAAQRPGAPPHSHGQPTRWPRACAARLVLRRVLPAVQPAISAMRRHPAGDTTRRGACVHAGRKQPCWRRCTFHAACGQVVVTSPSSLVTPRPSRAMQACSELGVPRAKGQRCARPRIEVPCLRNPRLRRGRPPCEPPARARALSVRSTACGNNRRPCGDVRHLPSPNYCPGTSAPL